MKNVSNGFTSFYAKYEILPLSHRKYIEKMHAYIFSLFFFSASMAKSIYPEGEF